MRLEHQSDIASPRSRSPLGNAQSQSREPPLSPHAPESVTVQIHAEHNQSSTVPSVSQSPLAVQDNSSSAIMDGSDRGLPPSQSEHSTEISYSTQQQRPARPKSAQQEHRDHASSVQPAGSDAQEAIHKTDIIHVEPERDEMDNKIDVKIDQPVSPPKQPRFRDAHMLHSRESRSPPRGPRNHSRNMAAPAASSLFPLVGLPRGPRRQYPQPTSQDPTPSISPDEPTGLAARSDMKVTLPVIPPAKPRPNLTPELDIEVCFLLLLYQVPCLTKLYRLRGYRLTELISLLNTYRYQKELDEHYMSWIPPHLIYVLQKVDGKLQILRWKKRALEYSVSMLIRRHLLHNRSMILTLF
jgi:hypothetical protein